jgi:hypothetical protein
MKYMTELDTGTAALDIETDTNNQTTITILQSKIATFSASRIFISDFLDNNGCLIISELTEEFIINPTIYFNHIKLISVFSSSGETCSQQTIEKDSDSQNENFHNSSQIVFSMDESNFVTQLSCQDCLDDISNIMDDFSSADLLTTFSTRISNYCDLENEGLFLGYEGSQVRSLSLSSKKKFIDRSRLNSASLEYNHGYSSFLGSFVSLFDKTKETKETKDSIGSIVGSPFLQSQILSHGYASQLSKSSILMNSSSGFPLSLSQLIDLIPMLRIMAKSEQRNDDRHIEMLKSSCDSDDVDESPKFSSSGRKLRSSYKRGKLVKSAVSLEEFERFKYLKFTVDLREEQIKLLLKLNYRYKLYHTSV